MPIVYAGTNDGYVKSSGTTAAGWPATRDATSGTSLVDAGFIISPAVGTQGSSVGFGGEFGVFRTFFQFDVSAITSPLESATISFYSISIGQTMRFIKSKPFTSLALSDFDNLAGFTAGQTMAGNVTDYIDSAHIASSGMQTVTLNAQARADILSGVSYFNVAFVGEEFDYLNVDPGASGFNGVGLVYNEFSGTVYDCRIDYEYAVASKSALAGSDFTRKQIRNKTLITAGLAEDSLYEVLLVNDSPNQVYFTMEGNDLFRKPGETTPGFHIQTTDSVSGSNVIDYVQENPHASFILAGASSSSFLMSSSVGTGERPGNSIIMMATNNLTYSTLDPTSSGSALGANVEIFDLT